MTNKILMVGVLDVPSSTNVFMAKGFEQLGYEVDVYNYRTVLSDRGMFMMWDDFKAFLIDKDYRLIVFCKTNTMHPELLSHAKEIAPTWYWFMDPIGTAKAVMAQEYALHATHASATSSEVVKSFKDVNENSYHIIEGYDPEIYYYEDLEKKYDITFIGNATPQRANYLMDIKKATGKHIHICGTNWPLMGDTSVFNEKERKVINQSKIILNLCQDDTIFSDRVVKSLACGALVLSQYSKDLEHCYLSEVQNSSDNSLLQLWDSTESAHHLINIYLKNPGINKTTRMNLSNYMKMQYSWASVAAQMMKILEKVK